MTHPGEQHYPPGVTWDAPIARGTLPGLLADSVQKFGDRTAIEFRDQPISFNDLQARVDIIAAALMRAGYGRGSTIGIFLGNTPDHPVHFFGGLKAGARLVHLSPLDGEIALSHKLKDSGARVLVTSNLAALLPMALKFLDKGLLDRLIVCEDDDWGAVNNPQLPLPENPAIVTFRNFTAGVTPPAQWPEISPDDVALLQYTGGTTGLPKGVMLTHGNLYAGQLSANMAARRPDEAVGLNMAPMFHVGGAGLTLQLMLRLCTQVIIPAFDEIQVLEAIQDEGASETFMVPTMLKRLIEHPRFAEFDTSSLRLVLYGAAPIDDTLLMQSIEKLPRASFCQLYGMTELSPVVTVLPAWCHHPDEPAARRRSAGRPVPIAELRIVDAEGRPVPHGTVGEIAVRGPMVMAGYWNQPEQTAEVLRDGWMHTGDGGVMDDDGFVYVVDRLKDMIVTGGENVYSAEVENAITQLPQVSMCAVIGVPDERWGERVHAVVVLRAGQALDEAALLAHCKAQIAGYKCPRSVEFKAEIPLSPAGKMLKYKLREPYWAGQARRVA